MKRISIFACLLFMTSHLFASPYFSEYHENHFIIVFRGEVDEKNIPKIKALERRYIEEMTTLMQTQMNISEELEKMGVSVEVIADDAKVLPRGYRILPNKP